MNVNELLGALQVLEEFSRCSGWHWCSGYVRGLTSRIRAEGVEDDRPTGRDDDRLEAGRTERK